MPLLFAYSKNRFSHDVAHFLYGKFLPVVLPEQSLFVAVGKPQFQSDNSPVWNIYPRDPGKEKVCEA